jgi:NAD(P)-dependent dehydrogenase (short-subunit alcohol dehydrogenase family)
MATSVARRLIEKKLPGRIVNIASIAAYHAVPDTQSTLYAVSKSAVLRMTECLAMEWARHHINVNAIAPGIFLTEMMQANLSQSEERLKRLPRGRFGEPHQLDSTLLYLVAPASEFVTGICLRVDDAQTPR